MDFAHLHSLTGAFRGRRVVVIGDVVADEFVYGRVARVSREAPVLILEYDSTEIVPGGAGSGEALADPAMRLRDEGLGQYAASDAALIGDDHNRKAGAPKQADRVHGERINPQFGEVREVADVLVDRPIAIEEDRWTQ